MKKFLKSSVQKTSLDIEGKAVPVKIYREYRTSVRASIGKTAAILRIPILITKFEEEKHLKWFKQWVTQQVDKHPYLQEHFFGKGYKTGDKLNVGRRQYLLAFDYGDRKSHHAKLENGTIYFTLSQHDNPAHLQKAIKQLLSKIIGNDFLPEIIHRVRELNHKYFKKDIKNIKLKYNKTNWGSCSTNKNINLSTRLLFAPDEVIDYVIIHELAHLVEMNHSARFWKLVSDVMPNYKLQEKWLKDNWKICDF